jgi:glutaredoxin
MLLCEISASYAQCLRDAPLALDVAVHHAPIQGMALVTLYTRDGCVSCDRLRAALVAAGETIDEVNVDRWPAAIPELLKLTRGRRVVPVLVRGARIEIAPDGGSEF